MKKEKVLGKAFCAGYFIMLVFVAFSLMLYEPEAATGSGTEVVKAAEDASCAINESAAKEKEYDIVYKDKERLAQKIVTSVRPAEERRTEVNMGNVPKLSSQYFSEVIWEAEALAPEYFMTTASVTMTTINGLWETAEISLPGESRAEEDRQRVDAKAGAVVKTAERLETDREKIKFVHDLLCKTCEYENEEGSVTDKSAYGCLVRGRANCQGYSEAFYRLLSDMEIPCMIVANREGTHCWNVVKAGGIWYHIDVTWDDAGGSPVHDYFLIPESEMKNIKDHYI